jgi:hypothetical protein
MISTSDCHVHFINLDDCQNPSNKLILSLLIWETRIHANLKLLPQEVQDQFFMVVLVSREIDQVSSY